MSVKLLFCASAGIFVYLLQTVDIAISLDSRQHGLQLH